MLTVNNLIYIFLFDISYLAEASSSSLLSRRNRRLLGLMGRFPLGGKGGGEGRDGAGGV